MKRTGPRSSTGNTPNSYCRDMTEALEADPPVIKWRKGKGGIRVAVEVHDPHAERSGEAQAERVRASVLQAELEFQEALQRQADEVADRFRKHRAENTPLLNAARTAI